MSIEVPLQYNADTKISQLGDEFRKIQRLDADRGLIDPTIRTIYTDSNRTDNINLAGVDMKDILANNANPSEELYQTDAQAQLYLNRALDANQRALTETEKEVQLYEDHDLDPRVRQELLNEAQRYGSNMFSTEAQDFVNTIQTDIKSYYDENNLYYQQLPTLHGREGALREYRNAMLTGTKEEAVAAAAAATIDLIQKASKREDIKRTRREAFVPKSKVPTTEERLLKKQGLFEKGERKRGFFGDILT